MKKSSSFKKRLNYLMDTSNVSAIEVSNQTGIPAPTISRYRTGIREPIAENIEKLAMYFNVEIGWIMGWDEISSPKAVSNLIDRTVSSMRLLSEEGQIRVADYADDLQSSGKYNRPESEPLYLSDCVETYTVARAAAGNGAFNDDYVEPVRHLIKTETMVKHDESIDVKGDSMSPTILDGDIAFVSFAFEKVDGEIYAVNVGDETVIKRCYFEENVLRLVSDNPDWEERVIKDYDLETVHIAGRVVGWTTPIE